MPSVSSSSRPKVLLSSTVMTPSLPTLSIASAMSSPMAGSAAEIDAVAAICSLVSTSLAVESKHSVTDSTAFSMPFFSDIGLAPAATLRRPSRTSAWASTVAVVVPSPATSSVFFATSLTSSAPIFSHGSSSSISLAMLTPSLVMVGAPHFFSRTTLRPLGPSVTLTASASVFMPRSRPRRASSLKAISFGITPAIPSHAEFWTGPAGCPRRTTPADPANPSRRRPGPQRRRSGVVTLRSRVPTSCLALDPAECKNEVRRADGSVPGADPGRDGVGEGLGVLGQHVEVETRLGELDLAHDEAPAVPHHVHPAVGEVAAEQVADGRDGLGGQQRRRGI